LSTLWTKDKEMNLDKYKYLFKEGDEQQKLWLKEHNKKRKRSRIKIWMPSKKKRKKYYKENETL